MLEGFFSEELEQDRSLEGSKNTKEEIDGVKVLKCYWRQGRRSRKG